MSKNLNIISGHFQVVIVNEKGAYKTLNCTMAWVKRIDIPEMVGNRVTLLIKDDEKDCLKSTDFNIKNVVFIHAEQIAENLSNNSRHFGGRWSEVWYSFQIWAAYHGCIIPKDLL